MHETVISPSDAQSVQQAAELLYAGELVAFPTETVYGLGADAENLTALARIYEAKGRPSNHPVIVHVAPGADLYYWAKQIPDEGWRLVECFWPGPLTLILPKADHVPLQITGGQDSVGVRCPSHPVAQALLTAFAQCKGGQGGVAAPSANRFGRISPTQAYHVQQEFKGCVLQPRMILEGGPAEVGIESTIVDVSRVAQTGEVAVLRPGGISVAQIEAALGRSVQIGAKHHAPRVSGSLKAHYAPTTPLYSLPRAALVAKAAVATAPQKVGVLGFGSAPQALAAGVQWVELPSQPTHFAHSLYALLRELDAQDFDAFYIEQLPTTPEWLAVADRLNRAAAAFEA
ncbi:MAG: L-threonylcarbamoyladenylate synthase [Paenalcaligenes sp.]